MTESPRPMRRNWKYLAALLTVPVLAAEAGDITLPKYTVEVSLSTRAAEKLATSGETVHVAAMYYGTALPGFESSTMGDFDMGREDVDIPTAGATRLGNIKLSSADMKKIKEDRPQLLINVYTSRKVFENNLLDCDIFVGSVDAAAAKPIKIACKLIAE